MDIVLKRNNQININNMKKLVKIAKTKRLKYLSALISVVGILFSSVSCNNDDDQSVLVSSTLLKTVKPSDLIAAYGNLATDNLPASPHEVEVYTLVYKTIDAFGMPVNASGIVVVPTVLISSGFPQITYLHGTVNPEGDSTGAEYYPSIFNLNA